MEVSQRAGKEEIGKEEPGRKPGEYGVTRGKRRMSAELYHTLL